LLTANPCVASPPPACRRRMPLPPPKPLWSRHRRLRTSSMCLGASAWAPRAVVPRRVARARPRDTHYLSPAENEEESVLRTAIALGLHDSLTPKRAGPGLPSSNRWISVLYDTQRWLVPGLHLRSVHFINYFAIGEKEA
jgi:hypothetical protein